MCSSHTFCCNKPSVHWVSCDILMHTLCRLMQTIYRHDADYNTSVQCCASGTLISGNFPHCTLVFAGPTWRQRDGSVLVVSRRFDGSRSRKTKGSLADTLQSPSPVQYLEAQPPHRMTHSLHGGQNQSTTNGFTALGHRHDRVSLRLCSGQVLMR